jgi:hypothetical protein
MVSRATRSARLEQFRNGQIGLVGDSVSTMANTPSRVKLRGPLDATQVLYDILPGRPSAD